MRKPVIAGNWKMYKTAAQTKEFINEFLPLVRDAKDVEIVIVPTFTSICAAAPMLQGTNVGLGAQNMHATDEGAFTGEISAPMLLEAGCDYVIIGHSERRAYFAETDETVNAKTKRALAAGLTPIVCVGELLSEREAGQTREVLERQVRAAFADVDQIEKVIVAYEPVWAIGTGVNATKEDAQGGNSFIRDLLRDKYGNRAENVRILYGGSVKSFNIAEYMDQTDIDGALVGGASLDPAAFSKIVGFRDTNN
ncbi:MAG: triose-phosphate isomerase [Candidatus Wallbacteria bacterium HGW-Wallbacteria-1]|jgi:triosephosphate isomerase|uniref:Triosephosphate isomerase n=1 Tax=Candidatus Wallbacteria bacterium HGW-Wallbacteria-1 TaxID=2013854 RepID=A0A2N1PT27_9BACT|nr:MAG: triose-phosphate isomerase [Candidatus Wallbacteria bacterium HGW-Wallbacteria-1]